MQRRIKTILSKHFLFEGLPQKQLELIVGCASNVKFDTKDFIFREGQEADRFYIIREGRVALESVLAPDREPLTIQILDEDDVLGWSWLFPPYRWRFDAKAIVPTQAIMLDGKFLRKKCEEDHDLGYELMKRFAYVIQQRLQAVRLQNPNMYAVHG